MSSEILAAELKLSDKTRSISPSACSYSDHFWQRSLKVLYSIASSVHQKKKTSFLIFQLWKYQTELPTFGHAFQRQNETLQKDQIHFRQELKRRKCSSKKMKWTANIRDVCDIQHNLFIASQEGQGSKTTLCSTVGAHMPLKALKTEAGNGETITFNGKTYVHHPAKHPLLRLQFPPDACSAQQSRFATLWTLGRGSSTRSQRQLDETKQTPCPLNQHLCSEDFGSPTNNRRERTCQLSWNMEYQISLNLHL